MSITMKVKKIGLKKQIKILKIVKKDLRNNVKLYICPAIKRAIEETTELYRADAEVQHIIATKFKDLQSYKPDIANKEGRTIWFFVERVEKELGISRNEAWKIVSKRRIDIVTSMIENRKSELFVKRNKELGTKLHEPFGIKVEHIRRDGDTNVKVEEYFDLGGIVTIPTKLTPEQEIEILTEAYICIKSRESFKFICNAITMAVLVYFKQSTDVIHLGGISERILNSLFPDLESYKPTITYSPSRWWSSNEVNKRVCVLQEMIKSRVYKYKLQNFYTFSNYLDIDKEIKTLENLKTTSVCTDTHKSIENRVSKLKTALILNTKINLEKS